MDESEKQLLAARLNDLTVKWISITEAKNEALKTVEAMAADRDDIGVEIAKIIMEVQYDLHIGDCVWVDVSTRREGRRIFKKVMFKITGCRARVRKQPDGNHEFSLYMDAVRVKIDGTVGVQNMVISAGFNKFEKVKDG